MLELIDVDHFPGGARFIGPGQLPAEALRLLWQRRRVVTSEQLTVAAATWDAFTAEDPRMLVQIMRAGTPALPNLAGALYRHLRELPSIENGLALTQRLILETLASEPMDIGRLFLLIDWQLDPLPWLGDIMFMHIVEDMLRPAEQVLERASAPTDNRFQDRLAITDLGRAVLRGERDWLSLQPPPRWIGGVRCGAGAPDWRWNEERRQVELARAG